MIGLFGFGALEYHAKTLAFMQALEADGVFLPVGVSFALDRLVKDLNGVPNSNYTTYNVWSKYYAFYPFVGASANGHKYNLVDPRDLDAAFRLTFVGSPTHSANGVKFNGASQYARTHLDLNAIGAAGNNMHISAYNRQLKTGPAYSACTMGVGGTGADYVLLFIGGNISVCLSQGTNVNRAITTNQGYFASSRLNNTQLKTLIPGGGINTAASNMNGNPPPFEMFLGAMNQQGTSIPFWGNDQLAQASIGTGLTDNELLFTQAAINAFQINLRRNV